MKLIDPSASVDQRAIILTDNLDVGAGAIIQANAIIGLPNPDQTWFEGNLPRTVRIGAHSIIYPGVVIYEGAEIGECVELQEYTTVGSATRIGARTRLLYRAQVYHNVLVGEDCVIGALVANNIVIGRKCSIFGALVHRYAINDPKKWDCDCADEHGPTIEDGVLVGMGAVVVGPIRIGSRSQIRPNVLVKHDVPEGAVVRDEDRGPGSADSKSTRQSS